MRLGKLRAWVYFAVEIFLQISRFVTIRKKYQNNPEFMPLVQCVLHMLVSFPGVASLNIAIRENIFREMPQTNNSR